jgi:hypothetical protein
MHHDGLRVSRTQLESAIKSIRSDRAKAYEADIELRNFAAKRSAALSARGYFAPGAAVSE